MLRVFCTMDGLMLWQDLYPLDRPTYIIVWSFLGPITRHNMADRYYYTDNFEFFCVVTSMSDYPIGEIGKSEQHKYGLFLHKLNPSALYHENAGPCVRFELDRIHHGSTPFRH